MKLLLNNTSLKRKKRNKNKKKFQISIFEKKIFFSPSILYEKILNKKIRSFTY